MNNDRFEKLDAFLREHRPIPPAAAEGEYQGILKRIRRPTAHPTLTLYRSPLVASLGSLAALFIAWVALQRPLTETHSETAEKFVLQTLAATIEENYLSGPFEGTEDDLSLWGELD